MSVVIDAASADAPPTEPMHTAPWVIAAMAKDVFLHPTATWAARLEAAGRPAIDVRADRARRSDLLAAVADGPGVVLYAGHGRPRGWAGYQALRIDHFDRTVHDTEVTGRSAVPIGLVIAFACSTLDRSTDRIPFGQLVVDRGLARGYLAPAGPVVTAEAEVLADLVVELLCAASSSGEALDTAGLVSRIDDCVAGPAASAWSGFEFVGDATTRLL